jgi:hypothetical protein
LISGGRKRKNRIRTHAGDGLIRGGQFRARAVSGLHGIRRLEYFSHGRLRSISTASGNDFYGVDHLSKSAFGQRNGMDEAARNEE